MVSSLQGQLNKFKIRSQEWVRSVYCNNVDRISAHMIRSIKSLCGGVGVYFHLVFVLCSAFTAFTAGSFHWL